MADQARKQTDKILSDMEKEVRSIYDRASADISAKWYKYMESHEKSLKSAYNALQEALKSGDNDAIAKARSDYERILKNVTLNNDKYKAMLNETTAKLSHTNEVALDYVNGNMAKIYTLNYNEFANQDITGYTFTLVNEQAVKNLATEDKSLLPKKKVDIPKDKLWNQKNINSEVLQGILQGENITKIADRLQHVTDMNKKSAIRNARTMVTGAENKGRQDSFKKAESDGVILTRRWVATHDERTRAWHTDLDGVEVGLDEPWTNEYGEIMYPGDPSADPANVYNCRCSIRSIIQGFKRNEEVPDEVPDKDLSFEEKLNNIETVNFNLEPDENSNIIKVPFELENHPKALKEVGLYTNSYTDFLTEVNKLPYEEKEIPLKDIITIQSIVSKEGVLKSLGSKEPIDVVLVDGKYYLFNGNHRATAAKINGDKKILAKVRKIKKVKK